MKNEKTKEFKKELGELLKKYDVYITIPDTFDYMELGPEFIFKIWTGTKYETIYTKDGDDLYYDDLID